MQYIAALDYDHLDNGLFLTTLAQSISKQKQAQPIIIHGGSSYTERIIQDGVMREDAQIRSYKELNNRLVTLLADQGVSAIGINGYQRKFITLKNETLKLDRDFFNSLPNESTLVISCLVWNEALSKPVALSLSQSVLFLQDSLDIGNIFAFSASDTDEVIEKKQTSSVSWQELPTDFAKKYIPREFHGFNHPLQLTTADGFKIAPENKTSIFIQ